MLLLNFLFIKESWKKYYDLVTKNGIEHSFGKKKPIVGYVEPFSKI